MFWALIRPHSTGSGRSWGCDAAAGPGQDVHGASGMDHDQPHVARPFGHSIGAACLDKRLSQKQIGLTFSSWHLIRFLLQEQMSAVSSE